MAGDITINLAPFATAQGLAEGFETGALGEADNFVQLATLEGLLEAAENEDFGSTITAYKWAVALGNRDLVARLGPEIAKLVREKEKRLNGLLATVSKTIKPPKILRPRRVVMGEAFARLDGMGLSLKPGPKGPLRSPAVFQPSTLSPEQKWPGQWEPLKKMVAGYPSPEIRHYIRAALGFDHPLLAKFLDYIAQDGPQSDRLIEAVASEKLSRAIQEQADPVALLSLSEVLDEDCEALHVGFELDKKGISQSIWQFFKKIVESHPDPWLRYYVLKIVFYVVVRDYSRQYEEEYTALAESALKDKESLNILVALHILEKVGPLQNRIPEGGLNGQNSRGTAIQRKAQSKLLSYIFDGGETVVRTMLSIQDLKPASSPAGLNSDPERYYRALLDILAQAAGDRDQVFKLFFGERKFVKAIRFSNGDHLLIQEVPRFAALKKAADQGLIPQEWLDRIPVETISYNLVIPEFFARQILTSGIDWTWEDIK